MTLDQHYDESRRAQREADRWLIIGTILMGTLVLGPIGLPVFCRGVVLFRRAQHAGVALPVIGWWLYNTFYITPFLAIPYWHTVNREIFSD